MLSQRIMAITEDGGEAFCEATSPSPPGRTLFLSNRRYGTHRVKRISPLEGSSEAARPSGRQSHGTGGGKGWRKSHATHHWPTDGAGTSNVAVHDLAECEPSVTWPRTSVPSTDPTYTLGASEKDRCNSEPSITHRCPVVAQVPEMRFSSIPCGMNRKVTFCSPSSCNTHVEPVRPIIYPESGHRMWRLL